MAFLLKKLLPVGLLSLLMCKGKRGRGGGRVLLLQIVAHDQRSAADYCCGRGRYSCVCSSIACMLMKSNSILLCDEYMPEGSYGAAAVEAEKS